MDDLATWLRAQLDHHADVHRKLVLAEGDDPTGEREVDPDGFWAFHDAHTRVLDLWHDARHDTPLADEMLKAVALAYQHADGYREEWRP